MQRSAFDSRTISSRLALLALAFALATGCESRGRIGRQCGDGGDCQKPVDCADGSCEPPPCVGDACNPPPAPICTPDRCDPGCDPASCMPPSPCDGAPCEEPPIGCDAASCGEIDACANGACEVDACAGLQCDAPSCDGGVCQAGVCDGGACDPEPGCNSSFPICARCQENDDCRDDREDPYCDRARGRCVECLDDSQCSGVERWCVGGECEECRTDDDCAGSLRCSNDGDCGLD
jgi:hypothetical protein